MSETRPEHPNKTAPAVRGFDAKSFVLFALVLTSVLLTGLIWKGTGGPAVGFDPLKLPSRPLDLGLESLFRPRLILVHAADAGHYGYLCGTENYSKLWDDANILKQVLHAVTGARKEPVSAAELESMRTRNAIELVFGDGHSLSELSEVYGGSAVESLPRIDRLILSYSAKPAVYARTYPDGNHIALSLRGENFVMTAAFDTLDLAPAARYHGFPASVKNTRILKGTYVPQSLKPMAALAVQRDPSGASVVLSTFFLDVSLLRRIEERDGALIYSDGRRGIRIYPSGAMDYGQPAPGESSVGKMRAIQRAALFAIEHGGLPGTAYIDRLLESDDESVRVMFNFRYAGVPVIGTHGVIEVLVGSGGAQQFLRNFRAPVGRAGEESPLVSIEDAISAVERFQEDVPGAVAAIELAYLNGTPEDYIEPLRPVWHIEYDSGWSFAVDAHHNTVTLLRRGRP